MATTGLKAPFPYFGGKSRAADLVWDRLGDVDNYIEPFAGSLAMLLARPHPPRIETVNDLDCFVANFWRSTQHDPEAVAAHADSPVNEADLHARHRWLVLSEAAAEFRQRMRSDPDYFDPKIAGWWCWGLCCWIGSGWCDSTRIERDAGSRPAISDSAGRGVHNEPNQKRPQLHRGNSNHGRGVHGQALSQKMPMMTGHSGTDGRDIHDSRKFAAWSDANRPQLADAYARGRGVHGNDAAGTCAQRRAWLLDWFGRLRDRLRTVRVCCGHWLRVCNSPSVTTRLGVTGVFLDPPYLGHVEDEDGNAVENRNGQLYAQEDLTVGYEVRAWCLERGGDPMMRIALCGYEGEHDELEAAGWAVEAWKPNGGYANRSENANKLRERIWFSPACAPEMSLFNN